MSLFIVTTAMIRIMVTVEGIGIMVTVSRVSGYHRLVSVVSLKELSRATVIRVMTVAPIG